MALTERKLEALVWDNTSKGVEHIGRLVSMDKVKFKNGDVGLEYRLRQRDGGFVIFLGTTDINRKLTPRDIGCVISILYKGEDESREMSGDKNRPKNFIVLVDEASKPQTQPAPSGEYIATDDDIPF